MRLYPPEPHFQSAAEQVVWKTLIEQLPTDSVMFHGLRFSDRRQDREADVIVAIADVGVVVLEVKGGQITLDEGRWTQLGRGMTRIVDPVGQARACKYLLRDYLNRHSCWQHGSLRSVHMVAFPFTTVPEDFSAPDCPRWMVIGREDLQRLGPTLLDALNRAKEQPDPPSKEHVEDLITCLAGRMLTTDGVLEHLPEDASSYNLLTHHQGQVLDLIQHLNRVEIRGGPGTGKTWLALEKSRRLAARGKRVGLVCHSHGLSLLLRKRVATFPQEERPFFVGSLRDLAVDWLGMPTGEHTPDGTEAALRHLAHATSAIPAQDRFDALIMDEGHRLTDPWWPVIQSTLRNPDTGSLFSFVDEGPEPFPRRGTSPLGLIPLVLSENLRHTPQIAKTFQHLMPQPTRLRGVNGPPVQFFPSDAGTALSHADEVVAELLTEGWAAHQLVVLTTGEPHPEHQRLHDLDPQEYWRRFWTDDAVFHSQVTAFRGLERPAVVIVLNGFDPAENPVELLYTGFSRARDQLIIVGDPALISEVGGPRLARYLGISTGPGTGL